MQKDLEKFINENREAFDSEIPSLKVWAAIDKQLSTKEVPQAKNRTLWRYAWIAASIIFLLSTGVFLGQSVFSPAGINELAGSDQYSEEYLEMKQYYEAQINNKQTQLVRYNEGTSINMDLAQIDDQLQELKEEIKNAPEGSEEQIINAMINNYQTKVAILERVLERLENSKEETTKNKDHETNI